MRLNDHQIKKYISFPGDGQILSFLVVWSDKFALSRDFHISLTSFDDYPAEDFHSELSPLQSRKARVVLNHSQAMSATDTLRPVSHFGGSQRYLTEIKDNPLGLDLVEAKINQQDWAGIKPGCRKAEECSKREPVPESIILGQEH